MKGIGKAAGLVCLLAGAFLLAACSAQERTAPPDHVTLQLKWVHQAQFAGFYLAQEQGYYAAENIQVEFLEGGPGIDSLDQVTQGLADFGVVSPDDILLKRAAGDPVLAIATLYQRSPVVYVALADSGITRPGDLLGRQVAVVGPADLELQFRAMIEKLGLDIQQIDLLPHSYDLTLLTGGQVDCIGLYATGGLIRLEQGGYQTTQIWPGDYGVHMYADTLATRDQIAAQNPELVTRFLRASLRGWQEAIGDVDAAVTATLRYAREADADLQAQMLVASQPLIVGGDHPLGWMDAAVWGEMHALLRKQGLLAQDVDLNQAFTLEFLEAVYTQKP